MQLICILRFYNCCVNTKQKVIGGQQKSRQRWLTILVLDDGLECFGHSEKRFKAIQFFIWTSAASWPWWNHSLTYISW